MANPSFRFDASAHQYVALDTGEVLPHITGFMRAGGLIDDRWFTAEHSNRGKHVHTLTADYDHGAIENPAESTSMYKGYLLGYVAAKKKLMPEWEHIETAFVHWGFRFGGRPDRVGRVIGGLGVGDVKSGIEQKAAAPVTGGRVVAITGVQTALQSILISPSFDNVPPESIFRFGIYVKSNGKHKVVPYDDPRDFDIARRLLRDYRHLALDGMAA